METIRSVRSLALNRGVLLVAFSALFVAALATDATVLFAPAGLCVGIWGARVAFDHRGIGSEWAHWRKSTEVTWGSKGLSDRDLMLLEGGIGLLLGIGCLAIGLA